ncbi:MAG: MFS transporter [Euryarchaeota archaeon]|nr:MFS transporter [Euryarchaeota archaeon]
MQSRSGAAETTDDLVGTVYLRLLSSLYIATFLIRASFGIALVALNAYIDVSPLTFGLIVSAAHFFELFAIIAVGYAIDVFGRRPILLMGLLIGGAARLLTPLTTDIYALAGISALHGVAAACILISSLALLADYAHKDHRGREMGAFDFMNVFGYVAGLVAGFLMRDYIADPRVPFIFAGAIAIAGFAYAHFNVRDPHWSAATKRTLPLDEMVRIARLPRAASVILPWFLVFVLISGTLTFFPRATATLPSLSGSMVAVYTLVGGGLFLATQVFFGRLSDSHGRTPVMLLGASGFLVFVAVIAYAFMTAPSTDPEIILRHTSAFQVLLAPAGLVALAFGPSALASLADFAQEHPKGLTMALYSVVVTSGSILGPPLVGYVSEAFGTPGVVVVLCTIAVTLFALVLRKHVDETRKPAPLA